MANDLLKFLAENSDYCCSRMLLHEYGIKGQQNLSKESAQEIADKIGVTVRTIYNWNRRVRDLELVCEQNQNCTNHRLTFLSK